MLVEKYEPVNLFAVVPLERDRVLDQLDRLLDTDALFQAVKADLARRYPRTLTRGRRSTPVEVILRMLAVKHLYQWSYEQTETFVADSIILRQFCRVYLECVPDDSVLIRWANLIRSETLHQLLEHGGHYGPSSAGHTRPQAAHGWHGGGERHSPAHRQ